MKLNFIMKKAIVSLLSIFMLLESMSLYAWGPMGHDVVAAIAEQHLDRKTMYTGVSART